MKPAAALALLLPALHALAAELDPLEPLEDNSFLVEEAYNQEPGVVQHAVTFSRDRASGSWLSTFTHELPAPTQAHQLSYTIPLARLPGPGSGTGLGDVVVSYRYQLAAGEAVACAPRLSAVLPTGDTGRGLGQGGLGAQVGLAVSSRLTKRLVSHSNLGVTWIPSGKAGGARAEWLTTSAGQGLVATLTPRLDLLAEVVWSSTDLTSGGLTRREQALTVSPGVRFGVDLPGSLQVVVGVAAPLGIGPSAGERGLFLYLSAELPYWHAPEPGEAAPAG